MPRSRRRGRTTWRWDDDGSFVFWGRLAPEGLRYLASWVTTAHDRCYQVMECDDRALLDERMAAWDDIVRFEVVPVVTSAEAVAALAPHL